MKKWRALLPALALTMFLPFQTAAQTATDGAYSNYIYDYAGRAQAEPQAYVFDGVITGDALGIGDFSQPGDVFVARDDTVFVADTGNNRIVELDASYRLVRVVDGFDNNGAADAFNGPSGVFVTAQRELFVADTENHRVVRLDQDGKLMRIYEKPQSKLITDQFDYEPSGVAVDSAGRIFIVSRNVNLGIIELDPEGEFVCFFGAVKTVPNLMQSILKLFSTKEQRERMQLTLPTEYSSLDIDDKGFVYGTVSAIDPQNIVSNMFISRLNPTGADVLKREGFVPPMGDVEMRYDPTTYDLQPSQLGDVAARDHGVYSVLDNRMGRIFTYSGSGDLMYVFGGLGSNRGQFGRPQALDVQRDEIYLVADSMYGWIAVYKPTEYASLITRAVQLFYQQRYDEADELWGQALDYTANSDLVYNHIGRSLAKKEQYREAMDYLEISRDRVHFSDAFEYYRSQIMGKYFNVILVAVIVLILAIVARSVYKRVTGKKEDDGS